MTGRASVQLLKTPARNTAPRQGVAETSEQAKPRFRSVRDGRSATRTAGSGMGPPPDREPDAADRRTLDRREEPMRLIDRRAAGRRGLACIVAIAFCLAPVISGVRAQET